MTPIHTPDSRPTIRTADTNGNSSEERAPVLHNGRPSLRWRTKDEPRTGKAALDGFTQTLPAIYAMTTGTNGTQQLYDVTSGLNAIGSATAGYELVSVNGTPRRADLVYQAPVNA